MIVKTRNGSFANEGYGGGTFNGNTAFGGLGKVQGRRMRQHQYRDISNLNAPYDNMSLQGLGSLSGGPFGSTEAATLQDLPVEDHPDYPWREVSSKTMVVQKELNAKLLADGFGPLLEDGKLGPRTCGALKFYGLSDWVDGACEGRQEALIAPSAPAEMPPQLPTQPTEEVKTGGGSGAAIWIGILLAGGAVGLAIYAQKRKGKTVKLQSWG